MARTAVLMLLVIACFTGVAVARKPLAAAVAAAKTYATFYDALAADPAHKLIVSAIGQDAATKKMLQSALNVTAFVPTDKAFVQAALQYKIPLDPTKLSANACLINAILRYHIITPGMNVAQLKKLTSPVVPKNTLLLTSTTVNGKKTVAAKTLKFKLKNTNLRVVAGATSGLVVAPMNVVAGKGIIHNIDTLLLPTADINQLQMMTGCKAALS